MITVKIAPTNRCNLRCKSCYNASYFEDCEIPLEKMRAFLEDAKSNLINRIDLIGGEPMCYCYFQELCNIIKKKQIKATITTNATQINEENVDFLGVFEQITISLDGFTNEDNDSVRGAGIFNKVKRALSIIELKHPEYKVYLNCTMSKKALDNLEKSLEFAKYKCVKGIIINHPLIIGNAKKQDEKFWESSRYYLEKIISFCDNNLDKIKNYNYNFSGSSMSSWYLQYKYGIKNYAPQFEYCMASCFVYYIDGTGTVYPCNLYYGIEKFKNISKEENLKIGNINEMSFDSILELQIYNRFFEWVRKNEKEYSPINNSNCISCPFWNRGYCSIKCPFSESPRDSIEMCNYIIKREGKNIFKYIEKYLNDYEKDVHL